MSTNTKLVCDPSGKPILFEYLGNLNRCIVLVGEHLDYELTHERINNDCHGMVPDPELRQRVLSIPERASIATLAWHCREYGAGLKRGETVTMPIVNIADDIDGVFRDEGRAYMFAQVVETVFERSAQVVGNPYGWTVVVGSPDVPLDGEILAQLRGACRVLTSYPVGDYDDVFGGNVEHETYPDPATRQAWHDRHNAPLTRIESALGEILSRLDPNAATGAETPSTATEHRKARGLDALIAPTGKKASPKKSA
jgi:hypothetical protein